MSTTSVNPKRWWALVVLAAAQFMVIMDTSIIGVALPHIQKDLGFAQDSLSWVFNGYVIAFGGLLLLGGRLSDLLGARRVFSTGWAVLLGGSLLAALASSQGVEIAGRGVQGAGAALIAPSALTLLVTLFSHDAQELTKAFSLYGAAAPAGGTAGVFLGGVLTQSLSWPWVFLINVPVGIAVLAVTRAVLPSPAAGRGRVDIPGAVAVTGGIGLAVYAIVRAPQQGWGSTQTVAVIAAAIVALSAFVVLQRGRRDPLMALGVWRTPNLGVANTVMLLLGAAWIPMWFFLNLYLQQVLGYGAFSGGAALLPMTLTIMVVLVGLIGRLIARFGLKPLIVTGLGTLGIGVAGLALTRPQGTFLVDVLPFSLVAAIGMSLVFVPATMAAISGVPPEQGGLASGIVNTTYQVGSALGLAVMTALATSNGASRLSNPTELTAGFHAAFIGAASLAGIGAILALALMRSPKPSVVQPATDEVSPVNERAADLVGV